MSRPRVLHMIETLAPYGGEHSMLNICVALHEQYEPVVLAFGGGALETKLAELGIPAHAMPTVVGRPLTLRERFTFCWRKLKEFRPDIFHGHSAYPNTVGRIAAHLQGIPTVAHIRGIEGQWGTLAYRLSYRLAQRGRTQVVAVSEGLAREFQIATGLRPRVIHNAVDESWFAPDAVPDGDIRRELGLPPDTFLVGTVGRVTEVKMYPVILRCAQRVCRDRDDVHFVAAGDGELMGEMIAQAESLGLSARFHFLGRRNDVPRILADIDVYILMSRGEGFSRSILEAMWMRCPIVATNVMGIQEAFQDGVEGYLVPADDHEAAAERILQLYDDAGLRARMGEAGLLTAQSKYSIQALAGEVGELYDGLLAAGKPAVPRTGRNPGGDRE